MAGTAHSSARLSARGGGEGLDRESAGAESRHARAPRPEALAAATGVIQLFQSNGQVLRSETKGSLETGSLLPVTAATRAVAAGRRKAFFSDATVGGTHVRILTERAPEGGVWQVALPLTDGIARSRT